MNSPSASPASSKPHSQDARTVACLDVWTPRVREVVQRSAPPELQLRFASSYDEFEQFSLIENADAVLVGWAEVTAPMLAHARRLRMIQKWGIGVDRIDVDAASRMGVPVYITAGSNAGPVAELTIALILAIYRRLPYVDRAIREGKWPKSEMRESCFQIAGKTVGLIGFGSIGRMVARRLRGFDVQVLYYDTRRADPETELALGARAVSLPELLAQSDIVSLHAPANPQTHRLIDARAIAQMKQSAVLINTARGELVDEGALHAALASGKLHGAGLDAFDPEPPSADNPLLALAQVVVTPHAGGGVFDNVANVARHAFGNILRHWHGEPIAAADVVIAPGAGSAA